MKIHIFYNWKKLFYNQPFIAGQKQRLVQYSTLFSFWRGILGLFSFSNKKKYLKKNDRPPSLLVKKGVSFS